MTYERASTSISSVDASIATQTKRRRRVNHKITMFRKNKNDQETLFSKLIGIVSFVVRVRGPMIGTKYILSILFISISVLCFR